MSLISIENRRLGAVDYYLSGDKLFYVTESSDLMGDQGMTIEKESSYSRYIFLDNQIFDYERVGKSKNIFDKLASEKRIIKDSLRNIGLLKNKRTEKRNIE